MKQIPTNIANGHDKELVMLSGSWKLIMSLLIKNTKLQGVFFIICRKQPVFRLQ